MASRLLKDFRVQLVLVALFGLAVRVTAVLTWSRWFDPQGDQNFYWRQGQDLAQGYGFVYRNNVGERVATAVHPPLYSAYLGVVSFLGGTSHAWHRLASTLLGFAAVIVIGLVGRRLAGNRAGLLAAALAAIYPNLWLNDAMMLSESMYGLTIGLVFLTAYRYHDDPSASRAAFLGGAIALATLTRAEAAFLVVLLLLPLVARHREQAWSTRFARAGVGLGVAALVVAPWVVRNFLTFSTHPVTISNGSGFVVEISNCDQTYGLAPPTSAGADDTRGADEFLGYWATECDRTPWPPGDETVVGAAKQQTGTDYIAAHKRQFPVVVAARVGRIWDVWRPQQSYDFNRFFENRKDITLGASGRREPGGRSADGGITFSPVLVAMVMYYPMLLASVAALVVLWRRRITIIPFVAVIVMTTLTAAVSFGITRYRVGADVGLTILTGVALDALWRRVRGERPAIRGTEPSDRGDGADPSAPPAAGMGTTPTPPGAQGAGGGPDRTGVTDELIEAGSP